MFPSGYTWSSVLGNVQGFLSEPLVTTGVLFALALPFVPALIGTLRGALGERSYARATAGMTPEERLEYERDNGWYDYDED